MKLQNIVLMDIIVTIVRDHRKDLRFLEIILLKLTLNRLKHNRADRITYNQRKSIVMLFMSLYLDKNVEMCKLKVA